MLNRNINLKIFQKEIHRHIGPLRSHEAVSTIGLPKIHTGVTFIQSEVILVLSHDKSRLQTPASLSVGSAVTVIHRDLKRKYYWSLSQT